MPQPSRERSFGNNAAGVDVWRPGIYSRRGWLSLAASAPLALSAPPNPVGVLYRSGAEAFADAVEALKKRVESAGGVCRLLDLATGGERIVDAPCQLMVAMGGEALEQAARAKQATATIASMALRTDIDKRSGGLNLVGRVALDIPAYQIVTEVAGVLGSKTRLAMIRNPQSQKVADAAPVKNGTVQVVDCAKAEELLPTFLSLRNKADAVVAVPDTTLFNGATVKPLILASLENRLPIVGFSTSFVRAGAAIGIYPDFREIGKQTGDLTVRALAGERLKDETPRRLIVGVNPQVVRLLGLDLKEPRSSELVVVK
ncbi:MAG: hypothetical protein IT168_20075 [Bryobacterales bacterium]|nr:hypothetical protein [Bryobacterales bacterium]